MQRGTASMIPENIVEILLDNQDLITDEIDIINKSIIRISDALKSASDIILQKLTNEAKNGDIDEESEKKHLDQSQLIRKYAKNLHEIELFSKLTDEELQIIEENFESEIPKNIPESQTLYVVANQHCPICKTDLKFKKIKYHQKDNDAKEQYVNAYFCPNCQRNFILDITSEDFLDTNIVLDTKYYNRLGMDDLIVVDSFSSCSNKNHKLEDVEAVIVTILPNGKLFNETLNASYCNDCKHYFTTKFEFNKLKGVPICKVIDKTVLKQDIKDTEDANSTSSDKGGSKLTQHGYNVKYNNNLTKEQRQCILGMLMYFGMPKSEIISFLDVYIHSGELRRNSSKNWDNAVSKWKEDKIFVENFEDEQLVEKINIRRIVLKYARNKNPL